MSQFPALDVREKVKPKASRVLVIKGPKQTNNSNKSKNVWDKVATAATVAATVNSRPSSARSSPQSSRPSSPRPSSPSSSGNTFRSPTKTPWSGSSKSETTKTDSFPSLKANTFPSLPSTSPKHQMILNMRRTASGQQINNAWGGSEDGRESSVDESDSSSSKKKKGRKNKVLFRVGL